MLIHSFKQLYNFNPCRVIKSILFARNNIMLKLLFMMSLLHFYLFFLVHDIAQRQQIYLVPILTLNLFELIKFFIEYRATELNAKLFHRKLILKIDAALLTLPSLQPQALLFSK